MWIVFFVLAGCMTAFGLFWWLLIETEGVYLGRSTVIWLYDLYAGRYDRIKDFESEYEFALLAVPIMSAIEPHTSPLVLDVATGTGRLPVALLSHAHFDGHVVGVDLSRKMLQHAADKLLDYSDHVTLVLAPAEWLPFNDDSVDVVTCLEALEFMVDQANVVHEMARVLRPGGLMLLTNRINTKWMPGKLLGDDTVMTILEVAGMKDVEIEPWQIDYHRVWAVKAGDSAPLGKRSILEILQCPVCGAAFDHSWICSGCGSLVPVGHDGVLELAHLIEKAGRNAH
jgi:ubiquinone/menaquinone biosynthesis C-methylase UbiE